MQSDLVPELFFGSGNLLSIKCKWYCRLAYLEEFNLCPFKPESHALLIRPNACTGCHVSQFLNVAWSKAALLKWDLQIGIQREY